MAERDDIVAELRDDLMNRMEEKEEALGRPLTELEREAARSRSPVATALFLLWLIGGFDFPARRSR